MTPSASTARLPREHDDAVTAVKEWLRLSLVQVGLRVSPGTVMRSSRLAPLARILLAERFEDGRISLEDANRLWWNGALATYGAGRAESDYDFRRSSYAALWTYLVTRVVPSLRDGATLLDYGCGSGAWMVALGRIRPDVRYVGYDSNPAAREVARRLTRGLRCSIVESLESATVDLAICSAVLTFNAEASVRSILARLGQTSRRLVLYEPVSRSDRLVGQPGLTHDYRALLERTGWRVATVMRDALPLKMTPVAARRVARRHPEATVSPTSTPRRVLVHGVNEYVLIEAEAGADR